MFHVGTWRQPGCVGQIGSAKPVEESETYTPANHSPVAYGVFAPTYRPYFMKSDARTDRDHYLPVLSKRKCKKMYDI